MTETIVHPLSAITYNSNVGTGAFMEKREIESAWMPRICMHHHQFSSSLDVS
jgi:hypothetical protein